MEKNDFIYPIVAKHFIAIYSSYCHNYYFKYTQKQNSFNNPEVAFKNESFYNYKLLSYYGFIRALRNFCFLVS